MKALVALSVLAFSTGVFAETERAIYDIMYLPKAGTTYGISQWDYTEGETKFTGFGTANYYGNVWTQTIGHSFTDRLSVAASANYIDFAGTYGVSDPTVTARFRAMDESFRMDIIGGALISRGDSEGNDNLQGGHSLFAGLQVGGKSPSFQWGVLAQLTHNLERTTEQSGGDLEDDAHNGLLTRADVLFNLDEKCAIRPYVAVNFTESYDDNQNSETVASTFYQAGAEYQHLFSKDFMARVGAEYAQLNADTGSIENDAMVYRLGLNYQF